MTDQAFIDSCVRAINDYRSVHQAPPLTHNSVLSTVAQSWADKMARTGSFGHNPSAMYKSERLGENCACKSSSDRRDYSGPEVAENWYKEVKNYDFRRNSGPNTGHFTQLVWKASREIGIGKAQSRDGTWFVVANFYPAGNFIGRNAENVLPPGDGKKIVNPQPAAEKFAASTPSSSKGGGAAGGPWPMSSLMTPFRPTPNGDHVTFVVEHPGAASSAGYQRVQTPSSGGGSSGATVVQRKQQTKTVNGVTTTVVTETTRDRDGNVKTTTTETVTSRDDVSPAAASARSEPPPSSRFRFLGLGSDSRSRDYGAASATPTTSKVVVEERSSSPHHSRVTAADSRSTPGQRPIQNDREFASQVVQQHNIFRRQHGNVGDLKLNSELSKSADRWAAHLASIHRLEHSNSTYRGQPTGENIAYKFSSLKEGYTGEEVVKQWYSEISKCNFRQIESAVNSAGHFTQVVWKGSSEIGVGRAFADNGQTIYVVCNYFPPGNVIGRFKENVFPSS